MPVSNNGTKFFSYQVDGIKVHIQEGVVMTGPAVRIGLGGFWKFKYLSLEGAGVMGSCGF